MDGGYAATGYTNSYGANSEDFYIIKFDSNWAACGIINSPSSITGTGGTIITNSPSITSPVPIITSQSPTINIGGSVTRICDPVSTQPISREIPSSFKLSQNYPNPFNPSTKIKFDIPLSPFTKGG